MIKAAIIGGSGYTGLELLRILACHEYVEVAAVTSRQYEGKPVSGVFPALRGYYDKLTFTGPGDFSKIDAEVFFCCLPHGSSMEVVPALLKKGGRVIDLSADFRLKSPALYEKWYEKHKAENLLKEAVYGLPELNREKIKNARLVANPGCYPTGSVLALMPLLAGRIADTGSIIIDAKSGVSGAGRGASLGTSFVEVSEGFKAYKVFSHRHTPEIEQTLSLVTGKKIRVVFTPHLLPVARGILSTTYVKLKKPSSAKRLAGLYAEFYKDEPFIRMLPEETFPDIINVRGSNFCDIGLKADGENAVIISAIDNLVKGASGQAVQNMNIMCGLSEDEGLKNAPLNV